MSEETVKGKNDGGDMKQITSAVKTKEDKKRRWRGCEAVIDRPTEEDMRNDK